jgi:hypothetical protein
VNRSRKLGSLLLVLVSAGVLVLCGVGLMVRSFTNAFRSTEQAPSDRSSADKRVEVGADPTSRTAVRPPRPARSLAPVPALRPPKSDPVLAKEPSLAESVDAEAPSDLSDLTEEEKRAIEVRRKTADKDKLKLRQRRP